MKPRTGNWFFHYIRFPPLGLLLDSRVQQEQGQGAHSLASGEIRHKCAERCNSPLSNVPDLGRVLIFKNIRKTQIAIVALGGGGTLCSGLTPIYMPSGLSGAGVGEI